MNDQLQQVRDKLRKANTKRGAMAEVARDSGVSSRTIFNLLHPGAGDYKPNLATLDKLDTYFKKISRKANKEAV